MTKLSFCDTIERLFNNLVLEEYQKDTLEKILNHLEKGEKKALRIALCLPQGTGKTSLAVILILTAGICLASRGRYFTGFCVAGTWAQLRSCVWRTLNEYVSKLPTAARRHVRLTGTRITFSNNCVIEAKSWKEEDPHRIAGVHGDSVITIFDEATEIPEPVWRTADAAMTNTCGVWLAMCNPVRTSGYMYDIFQKMHPLWQTRKLSYYDVKILFSQNVVDDILLECGGDKEHPLYRTRILGEYVESEKYIFIQEAILRDIRSRNFRVTTTYSKMGVDVHPDEGTSYIVIRNEFSILNLTAIKADIFNLKHKILSLIGMYGVRQIALDEVGRGFNLASELRVLVPGISVMPITHKPIQTERYKDRRSELYDLFRDWLISIGEVSRLGESFFEELKGIKREWDLSLKIQIKHKNKNYPDTSICDAVAYTFCLPETNMSNIRVNA